MEHHKAIQNLAALFSGSVGRFDTDTRLHHIECEGPLSLGLVEAWCLREELNQPWRLEISVLSLRVDLDLDGMVGRRLDLRSTLSDGSEFWRGGIVMQATADDADGGFARYRLVVVSRVLGLEARQRGRVALARPRHHVGRTGAVPRGAVAAGQVALGAGVVVKALTALLIFIALRGRGGKSGGGGVSPGPVHVHVPN